MVPLAGKGNPPTNDWRSFGVAEDLEVDFAATDRPRLVTALLSRCGPRSDAPYWWDQAVSDRTAALLRLLASTDGSAQLGLEACCGDPACGERFVFDLPLEAVLEQRPATGPIRATLPEARPVTLRRPTGRDLLAWNALRPQSRQQALGAMLRSLVIEGDVSVEDAPAIAGVLAEADPLVAFSVSCTCPACDAPAEVSIDLEEIALTRLRQRQGAMLREIHLLASRYGWSEEQILAIPAARRARYLSLIEEGA
jgi:hypothetical protein